jgi:hypothetical protein
MIRKSCIFLLIFTSAGPVLAEQNFDSGNYMLPHCKALVDGRSLSVWEGHCGGLIDGLVWVGSSLPGGGRFCPPAGAPPEQAHRVVVGYLDRHPEKLHQGFKGLAFEALKEAWPCSKRQLPESTASWHSSD